MDPRLLQYYRQELLHVRETAAEFAREHPKIAARLALEATTSQGECVDPYVERLLEGFAFLTARVQIKQDAEYARFTQHLLELVYPGYQAPTPSMLVAQLQPDLQDAGLAAGPLVPRRSLMASRLAPGERTASRFATAHNVRLWPLQVAQARYQAHVTDLHATVLAQAPRARACLRLRLKVTAALKASQLKLDRLTLYLAGDESVAHRVYEQLFACTAAVAVVNPSRRGVAPVAVLPASAVQPGGLADDEAALPGVGLAFEGYRLLKEYAALPERYLFVHVDGLSRALPLVDHDEVELLFVLDRADNPLEKMVDASGFALHCTPAINLFDKRLDRVEVRRGDHEHHVVADKARPMDYEIYALQTVNGYDESGVQQTRHFEPLYNRHDKLTEAEQAYFSVRRVPRLLSEAQRQRGPRTGYIGTELYVALVDPNDAPLSANVQQLGIQALCSNRDLPLLMSVGGTEDFSFEGSFPVQGIRCIKGPTRPVAPVHEGETPWRLLSHLQMNYLSLVDGQSREGAAGLREVLSLYGLDPRSPLHKQVEGVVSVAARAAICRVPVPGPIAFGRGVEVRLTLDERAFEGSGILVLGTVLEHFLARHASLNSFVQLVLHSQSRGEVKRWTPRIGRRAVV